MNRFLKIFLLVFFILTLSLYPSAKRLYIGVIGPLTGINNFSGVEQLNGAELAFNIQNEKGGIKGYKIYAIPCDDRGNPEISKECTLKLIKRGCIAILGAINSSCTISDMEIAAKYKIPIITSSSTATKITEMGNKYIFRCIDSDFFRMAALADFLVEELSLKKFALFYEEDAYGKGLKKDFERNLERYGLKPTYLFPFKRGEKNFANALKECTKLKIEAIGLFGITEDNIFIAKEIFNMGYKFKLFSPDVNEKYLSITPEAVDGLVATDSFYLRKGREIFKNFSKMYIKRYGIPPGPIAGRAFDAASILIDALKRSKSFKGWDIRNALLNTDNFHGVTGDFNFKPNGDVVKKFSIIEIRHGAFVSPYKFYEKKKDNKKEGLFISLLIFALILNIIILKIFIKNKKVKTEVSEVVPIKINPYIVGNPIRNEKMFFGRDEDFKFIKNNISKGAGSLILLHGERRSGKSSILYQILNGRFGQKYVPFLFDMQLFSEIKSNYEFFEKISKEILKISKSLEPKDKEFENLLESLVNFNRDKKIIFMFDEYEIISKLIDEGKISTSILSLLSGYIERYSNLNYIFAGTKNFIENPIWQPLFNKSVSIKVSFLKKKDAILLITKPVKPYFIYEDGVVEKIYRLTNGHPFYTQAICMYIVDYVSDEGKKRFNFFDLFKVLQEIIDNPLPEMVYFWGNLSFREKFLLSLISEILEKDSEVVDNKILWNYIVEKGYPEKIGKDEINLIFEELYFKDILNKFTDGYNFKMDFFRMWIKKEHSIWQVIGNENS